MTALSGAITAFYLFDVAEAVNLQTLVATTGGAARVTTIDDKSAGPPRVRYIEPPAVVDSAALGLSAPGGFQVRVKFFDYGVISLALTQPFAGDWTDLVATGRELIENEPMQELADRLCQETVSRVRAHLTAPRTAFLSEDYLVFAIHACTPPMAAERIINEHGCDIAQLLRGERQTLSTQECEEVLRSRISYLADDLVVTAWNAALVIDTETAAHATLEVLEFANSQLLEFRYHDERLESALTRIYADLQHPRWSHRLIGRRYLRATRELHALFVDVNELTDRTENALKLVGDLYAARLFTIAATRLGLDHWKRNVEDKLKTLDDIYRFAVEQTRVSQGNLLELIIVAILVIELALTLRGLM